MASVHLLWFSRRFCVVTSSSLYSSTIWIFRLVHRLPRSISRFIRSVTREKEDSRSVCFALRRSNPLVAVVSACFRDAGCASTSGLLLRALCGSPISENPRGGDSSYTVLCRRGDASGVNGYCDVNRCVCGLLVGRSVIGCSSRGIKSMVEIGQSSEGGAKKDTQGVTMTTTGYSVSMANVQCSIRFTRSRDVILEPYES